MLLAVKEKDAATIEGVVFHLDPMSSGNRFQNLRFSGCTFNVLRPRQTAFVACTFDRCDFYLTEPPAATLFFECDFCGCGEVTEGDVLRVSASCNWSGGRLLPAGGRKSEGEDWPDRL